MDSEMPEHSDSTRRINNEDDGTALGMATVQQAFTNAGAFVFVCGAGYLIFTMGSLLLPFCTPLVSLVDGGDGSEPDFGVEFSLF